MALQRPGCPDQPIIGINNDKFVISGNVFSSNCSPPFKGAQFIVIDKQDLVNGISPPRSQQSPIDNNSNSVHPVISLSDTPILYMVSVSVYSSSVVALYSLSGLVPNVVATITYLPIQFTRLPPDAIQPLGMKLETGDARVQDAVWDKGNLWFTFNDACIPSGDTQTRSCFRLVNIDTTVNAVKQDFDVGSSNLYFFYPSIHLESSGNLNILFGYCSFNDLPGLLATNRLVNDPNNTVSTPATSLIHGMSVNGYNRYGDYFGSGLDPVYPFYNWLAGQYQGSSGWATFIVSLTSTPINLSNDLEDSLNPEIDTAGTSVYVVWDNKKDVLFTRSTDGGITFGNVINLSNNDLIHRSGNQKIAIDGNNIYVIWQQKTEDNCCWSVLFSYSHDNGYTFSPPMVLAENSHWQGSIFNRFSFPQLAVAENGDLFVVWPDNSMGNEDILFKKSTDNGVSFSSAENLSRSPGVSQFPYLAVSGNNVYVAWTDNTPINNHIFFTKSIDNGENFGIVNDLGVFGSQTSGGRLFVSAVENKVYVIWNSEFSSILFRSSLDNGNNFGNTISLTSSIGERFLVLDNLVASGNDVYVGGHRSCSCIIMGKQK